MYTHSSDDIVTKNSAGASLTAIFIYWKSNIQTKQITDTLHKPKRYNTIQLGILKVDVAKIP